MRRPSSSSTVHSSSSNMSLEHGSLSKKMDPTQSTTLISLVKSSSVSRVVNGSSSSSSRAVMRRRGGQSSLRSRNMMLTKPAALLNKIETEKQYLAAGLSKIQENSRKSSSKSSLESSTTSVTFFDDAKARRHHLSEVLDLAMQTAEQADDLEDDCLEYANEETTMKEICGFCLLDESEADYFGSGNDASYVKFETSMNVDWTNVDTSASSPGKEVIDDFGFPILSESRRDLALEATEHQDPTESAELDTEHHQLRQKSSSRKSLSKKREKSSSSTSSSSIRKTNESKSGERQRRSTTTSSSESKERRQKSTVHSSSSSESREHRGERRKTTHSSSSTQKKESIAKESSSFGQQQQKDARRKRSTSSKPKELQSRPSCSQSELDSSCTDSIKRETAAPAPAVSKSTSRRRSSIC